MIAFDYPQRSEAWRLARCGRLTASRAHDVITRGRWFGESITRAKYRRLLIVEQLTGIPEPDGFQSSAMRRGRLQEPAARDAYAELTGQIVHTSGFIAHDHLMAGASLDGHIFAVDGDVEGIVEIKNPNTLTHLRYLTTKRIPARIRTQMRHAVWITGARWCDFVSFDGRLPRRLQLLVIRFTREELEIPAYDLVARQFLAEVRAQVEPLRRLSPLEFFNAAPLDVARQVLAASVRVVDARKRERPAPAPAAPALYTPISEGLR